MISKEESNFEEYISKQDTIRRTWMCFLLIRTFNDVVLRGHAGTKHRWQAQINLQMQEVHKNTKTKLPVTAVR